MLMPYAFYASSSCLTSENCTDYGYIVQVYVLVKYILQLCTIEMVQYKSNGWLIDFNFESGEATGRY